jgi:hypothetical protein
VGLPQTVKLHWRSAGPRVLVWKFDRFARSTRHLLAALEEFNHLGVGFISVQDQVDTDNPMGRAMFTIIGAMAELESSLSALVTGFYTYLQVTRSAATLDRDHAIARTGAHPGAMIF